MRIQSQQLMAPARDFSPRGSSQPSIQLAPGDAYVPSSPNPISTMAAGAALGAGLGIYAGLGHGAISGVAGTLAGVGGGLVVGGVVGGVIGKASSPNSWAGFNGMRAGAPIGGVLGGVVGALASASPAGPGTAVALGLAGAAGGAVAGWLLGEARQ